MAEYRIEIGSMVFENTSIVQNSLNISTAIDIAGTELAADILTVVVDYEIGAAWLFSPADYDGVITEDNYLFASADVLAGDPAQTEYGTPILFYRDNALYAKFYVRSVERVGKTRYAVTAMSAVGFLDYQRHYGGVYSGVTVGDLIDEIIGSAFTYTVDQEVSGQLVSGWLPIDTARNNLHKVMFAFGIALTKDASGNIQFIFLSDSNPASVPNDRIYLGGSVDYPERVTDVEVWEHLFYMLPTLETEIFSNAGDMTADHLMVEFSDPYFDLRPDSENLIINEYGDNYAIVTGTGTLYGRKYFHSTNVISRHIADAAVVPNVITSSEDTLINSLNSRSVLERLVSYYSSRKTVKADILVSGEKAGSVISFEDAFGEASTGIIVEHNTAASAKLKATCKIITGYTPTGQGNCYTHRAFVSAAGTWIVPAGVTRIRIALIGGGGGGYGGYDGEEGAGGRNDPAYGDTGDLYPDQDKLEGHLGYRYQPDGQPLKNGGAGGNPGLPGKIYVTDREVSPGETITLAVGTGGAGGAHNGGPGALGTATTASSPSLGAISSDMGMRSDDGYFDVIGGIPYAVAGRIGYAGKSGGQTDIDDLSGWEGYAGLPGEAYDTTHVGGAGGAGAHAVLNEEPGTYNYGKYQFRASGGGGGGAAYGASGGAGTAGIVADIEEITITDPDMDIYLVATVAAGDGGAGANALPPPAAFYGCAGDGGNGGGAGGNAGGSYNATLFKPYAHSAYNKPTGERGTPGQGSVGGVGGAGCVIIYW